jgi:hypothetical protein
VAALFIGLCSRLKEPDRGNFSAVLVAGAGGAYFNGGFGVCEYLFSCVLLFTAYRGCDDYRFISVGWLLHTVWDVMHHLWGKPIISFVPTSSAGCAICDLALAAWYWCDAPALRTENLVTR